MEVCFTLLLQGTKTMKMKAENNKLESKQCPGIQRNLTENTMQSTAQKILLNVPYINFL
jgi:hypothetical protein